MDELEQEVHAFTVRLLALRQPVASDLRRTLDKGIDVREASIDQVMTLHGKTARAEMLLIRKWADRSAANCRNEGATPSTTFVPSA